MRKNILVIVALVSAISMMVSCKKDYQKLSAEFIRNMPDTCELLIQVDDEIDHVVYYTGENTELFFCWNAETGKSEPIYIPLDNETTPVNIGAGKENIIIGRKGHENECLQLYNLKEQRFKTFANCGWYEFNRLTKQVSCITENVDINGDGTRVTSIYDFDGKLLSKKESEVSNYNEVPKGTLAAKRKAARNKTGELFKPFWNNGSNTATKHYYCMLCGAEFSSVRDVTNNTCQRRGFGEKHILYEGSEKEQYACRFCGAQFRTIRDMTFNSCPRRGHGEKHIPAL